MMLCEVCQVAAKLSRLSIPVRTLQPQILLNIPTRTYASVKKKSIAGKAALTGAKKKRGLPEEQLETDPEKLQTYLCGGNINKEGEDPKLQPDSEYPDWLWKLRTDRRPPDISTLNPNSWYYWKRLKRMTMQKKNRIRVGKKFSERL